MNSTGKRTDSTGLKSVPINSIKTEPTCSDLQNSVPIYSFKSHSASTDVKNSVSSINRTESEWKYVENTVPIYSFKSHSASTDVKNSVSSINRTESESKYVENTVPIYSFKSHSASTDVKNSVSSINRTESESKYVENTVPVIIAEPAWTDLENRVRTDDNKTDSTLANLGKNVIVDSSDMRLPDVGHTVTIRPVSLVVNGNAYMHKAVSPSASADSPSAAVGKVGILYIIFKKQKIN